MITIKTPEEIELMRQGGKIASAVLAKVIANIKVGVKLSDLDKIAEESIAQNNALPSFKRVHGYKFATCINVNEGIVHGIPNETEICKGDLVKIDLGVFYKGFNTDVSYSVEVEANNEESFLSTGKKALEHAVLKCVSGNKIGDISNAIQSVIEAGGYSVSRELVGHGVGRELHEDPDILGYGVAGSGKLIKEGMVFAIEVIYQKGNPQIFVEKDGWTIRTRDRSLAGLFEQTVAVTGNGPEVLTSFLRGC